MSQKNWKLLFQEKALFLKLLESDSGKLSRPEALALVQGEGRRLDKLVRTGWILVLNDKILPGAALILAKQFPNSPSFAEQKAYWEVHIQQLLSVMSEMEATDLLPLREQKGTVVYENLMAIRSWAYLLQAASIEAGSLEKSKLALEFEALARKLRGATLRSSAFPAWEAEQWELIDFLEEQAAYLKVSEDTFSSQRLDKIKALSSFQPQEIEGSTNLKEIVESGDFLLLHQKLGVIAWPFLPTEVKVAPPAPRQDSVQFSSIKTILPDLILQWKDSGLDLLTFLREAATESDQSNEGILETFSRILAEPGEGVIWKKDASGQKWEAWPKN